MRRRRRARVTWLPNLGTLGIDPEDNSPVRTFAIIATGDGKANAAIIPLTFDSPVETDGALATDPLVNFVGSEYLLRRIVGKVYASVSQQVNTEQNQAASIDFDAVLFTCGFFVARANDIGSPPIGTDLPVGAGITVGQTINLYSPDHPDVIREPWIWRRTWILGNQAKKFLPVIAANPTIFSDLPLTMFPTNNAEYGSVHDGPHIDAKTRRRISSDDRLWFAIAARQLDSRNGANLIPTLDLIRTNCEIQGILDYRLVGSIRKAHNRGNF